MILAIAFMVTSARELRFQLVAYAVEHVRGVIDPEWELKRLPAGLDRLDDLSAERLGFDALNEIRSGVPEFFGYLYLSLPCGD